MAARDQRAILKKKFVKDGLACISLSLNVPGFPKSNATTKQFFDLCLTDLKIFLESNRIKIIETEAISEADEAGDLFIAPISGAQMSLSEIKQICEDFEAGRQLGRFVDVDLNDELGNTISSGGSKQCFYCREAPAIECRRKKAHDTELLRSFMFEKMGEFNRQQRETMLTKQISALALKALLYEISLTPKPGLVDKFSNGSHKDMNFLTFVNSTAAISVWLEELVKAGFSFSEKDFTRALPVIRNIGLRMESAMYQATGNINTQKGIIFLLGLSLFACGKIFSQGAHFETEQFRGIIKDICHNLVENELRAANPSKASHGEEIFQKWGFSGARGEAESGFRTVFDCGLPHLLQLNELNDEAMLRCFLAIAANNNDTNIIYRGGTEVSVEFKRLCRTALDKFDSGTFELVSEYCKRENISPGGSADLLAVSIFVWSVIDADRRNDLLSYSG